MAIKNEPSPPKTPRTLQKNIIVRLMRIMRLNAMNSRCCTLPPKAGPRIFRQYKSPAKSIIETGMSKFLFIMGLIKGVMENFI